MLKKDLILRNPLCLLGDNPDKVLPAGAFGAILARAGVGKTALVVQIALNSLLKDRNVLHLSLQDPVNKVSLWYEEVFRNIADRHKIEDINTLWESVLTNRFIMTFQAEGFSVPKLRERVNDLTEQGIFFPRVIIIDGLPFDPPPQSLLAELKQLAADLNLAIWFTIKTHREEATDAEGFPVQMEGVRDLFDVVLELQPDGSNINLVALMGAEGQNTNRPELRLDPQTMLVTVAGE